MTVTGSDITASMISLDFGGGQLYIYEDDRVTGTAADYGNLPTFSDGELILVAQIDPNWTAMLYDFDTDGNFTLGANGGTCQFSGGSRLLDMMDAEYYLAEWGLFGSPFVDPNPPLIEVPAGFQRIFNTKIVAPNDPSPIEHTTWGEVKNMFR